MEVGWGGEGGMVGNIGLLASHLSHLTKSHRPQKDILWQSQSVSSKSKSICCHFLIKKMCSKASRSPQRARPSPAILQFPDEKM